MGYPAEGGAACGSYSPTVIDRRYMAQNFRINVSAR